MKSISRRRFLEAATALAAMAPWTRGLAASSIEQPPDLASDGPYPVRTALADWQDARRERTVPLKLYVPLLGDATAQAPVTIFSHGLGGSREGGALWGMHWASHGYLAIHVQHPGSDETLWRGREPTSVREGLRRGISVRTALDRVADIRFVVDELERRAHTGDRDVAMADLARLGMCGHSFGAWTTLAVMGERALPKDRPGPSLADSRFRAAIAFSPAVGRSRVPDRDRFSAITRPFLSVTGTRDGDMMGTGATPERRREAFALMPPPDKYLLVLDGADHMVFNDGAKQPAFGGLTPAQIERIDRVVKATTLAYWNAYLRDDASARRWLVQDARTILAPNDVWEAK
jgi:predicted dienelactone hydrolase